jgi:glycosyltransferase involved in cell wall biosynthesis/radical SAM superfamily enzyme YgiQ (UPF0313 family)/MoaA/NifB/PqqE/SkfB family radical SAM enzyme/spore maturation protein CgeB
MNAEVIDTVKAERPDYVLLHAYKDQVELKTLDALRALGTEVIAWFSDDHWRFEDYSRIIAEHVSWSITTDKYSVEKYTKSGLNVIRSQWAANEDYYRKIDTDFVYDVGFIGQDYGKRREKLTYLKNHGIPLAVFGKGFGKYVEFDDMVRTINATKINLCLCGSSRDDRVKQIKGRVFEVPMCGGFLLTEYVDGIEEYYEIGKEIECFESLPEAVEKVSYYLKHEDKRIKIADRGYTRALKDHTWVKRLGDVFDELNKAQLKPRGISCTSLDHDKMMNKATDSISHRNDENQPRRVLLTTSAAPAQSPFATREKRPPIGVGFLVSALRNAGHQVFFIDNYLQPSDFLETDYLHKNAIDHVGIYANTICFRDALRMMHKLQQLRQEGKWSGKIIVGGPHTSVAAQTIPDFVDCIVQGEGEQAVVDIVDGKVTDRIVKYPRITDLDSLPMPAWDYFVGLPYDWGMKFIEDAPVFTMNTSRGCPFRCAFCSVGSIWGKKYTCFSAERIVSDIEYLIEKYGAKGIYFREDNFTLNQARITKFCNLLIKKGIDISWVCESRVSNLSRDLVQLMSRAGAKGFYFGVESGSQRMLDFLQKDITVGQIQDAFKWCHEFNIKAIASMVLGVPGETESDLCETSNLLKQIKPTSTWYNVYTGIPYSDLYHVAVNNRLYEYIDDRGLVYLQGHNNRVKHYYRGQWNACIPDTEQAKDWTNKPKVSVLMCVHNGERFVRQALESIYTQTYQDFEVIVVDDASTDRTADILLQMKDARTFIYRNSENKGLTKSLNIGLKLCRGEYVARMDADDISLPQRFEKQIEFLEKNPKCLVVGSWCAKIDGDGAIRSYWRLPIEYEDIREQLPMYNRIAHGTAMMRRSALLQMDGYDERYEYAQDYDLWLRLCEVGELRNLGEYLYALRRWDGAITNARRQRQDEYAELARQEAVRRRTKGTLDTAGATSRTSGPKSKFAVLAHGNNISFMEEIIARLRTSYDVWIVDCNDRKEVSRALMSADVCWIEWATDFAVRVTKLPRRCKTILRLHSYETFTSSPQKIHWENVDALILVSPYIREVLKDQVPDIEAKVRTHIVPNCVDLDKFYFTGRRRGKKIAFVAALRPVKNIPFLIQCFREIHAADPEYTLHVAGELFGKELHQNELHHYMKHAVKELGIDRHVYFYGRVQNVSGWLDDKDCILSTSIREAHPVNLIEGMAKGLKPVVHNFPGSKCLYPDKWIFNTAEECRDVVLSAEFDREEYRAYVREHWCAERVLPQIDALLASVSADRCQLQESAPLQREASLSRIAADNPKVSVIVTCYNSERFLPECLDSIRNQTLEQWELLLLDDASSDGTAKIIEECARLDPRIRPYYFNDNKGPYIRRNFAIKQAKSDFIVIQDADDLMARDKLETLYGEITQDERLGIVGSFYRMFLDEYKGIEHTEEVLLATTHEQIINDYTKSAVCDFCWHGSAIIRKEVFEELGPYDENPFASDSFWLAKVAEYASRTNEVKLKNIPEFLTLRRMHADSQTASLPGFDPRSRRAMFREYRRSRLSELAETLHSNPNADVKAALRDCVCSDFIPTHTHLFEQRENEPLHDEMIDGFIGRIFSHFADGQYVRCINTAGIVNRLVEKIERKVRCYDLLRGLAYFALGLKDESRNSLETEIRNHNTKVARDFLSRFLADDLAQHSKQQRREIVKELIFHPANDNVTGLPTAQVRNIQDYREDKAVELSIIVPADTNPDKHAEILSLLNEQTVDSFEVVLLADEAGQSHMEHVVSRLKYGVAVIEYEPDVSHALRKNTAVNCCKGRYVAFLQEDVIPQSDFVEKLTAHFRNDSLSGLRGRILTANGEQAPGYYDLGDSPLYAACDADEICVFRRDVFVRVGGFVEADFGQETINLSYRIYRDQDAAAGPIRYCPDVVVQNADSQREGRFNIGLYSIENRICIEQSRHAEQDCSDEKSEIAAFLKFVESLYRSKRQSIEQDFKRLLNNSLFFEKKFPQIAIGWAEKAVSLEPDSLKGCYVLGSSYCRVGQRDKAVQFFERILRPLEDALALNRLDPSKEEFGDYEQIGQCYLASCTRLATCYMGQGRYEEVERVYTRLLSNPHVQVQQAQKASIASVMQCLNRASYNADGQASGSDSLQPLHVDNQAIACSKDDFGQKGPGQCAARSGTDSTNAERGIQISDRQNRIIEELVSKYAQIPHGTSAKLEVATKLSELYHKMGSEQKSSEFRMEALKAGNLLDFERAVGSKPNTCRHKPAIVELNVITRCNAGCIMCSYGPQGEVLPLDRFKIIANELFPTAREVRLIGGEVLLHPDFYAICEYAHRHGVCLRMTTNLHSLAGQRGEAIRNFFDFLKVSVDGATPRTYESIRTGLSFDKLRQNLEVLAEIRRQRENFRLEWTFVAMRQNIEELPTTIEMARNYGFDSFIVDFVQVRRQLVFDDSLLFHRELANKYFDLAREKAKDVGIVLNIPNNFDLAQKPYILPDTATEGYKQCKRPWQRLRVLVNGDIIPCCHLHGFSAGNIFEVGFEQIWNGQKYQRLREAIGRGRDDMPARCKHCQIFGNHTDSNDAMLHVAPTQVADLKAKLDQVYGQERAVTADAVLPDEPKVSIITSCHNAEKYLRECLDSIRNQSLQQWELFLIDDGSADGTKELIQQYSRMDNRIRPYFFSDNKGPYVRRNFAIQQANADFVVIQDADDMMCPSKLQVLYEHINADEQLGAVGAFYGLFLEEFRGMEHTDTRELPLEHSEIVAKWSTWEHAMSQGSAIIRKKLFEVIGPYDENPFGADAFWFAKVAEYAKRSTGLKFKNLPKCLSLIRLRQGSQTASLPVYDPRSRRFRYKQYCEYKLRQLRVKLKTSPEADIQTELRNCMCSDFLERFKDHITQWESEPLDEAVISRLLDNAVALFNNSCYVSSVSVLNDIEIMAPETAKRFRNYNLLRALALAALDMKERSLEHLHRELHHHDNPAARQFIHDYFEECSSADVLKWCREHANLYELEMVDTQTVSQSM